MELDANVLMVQSDELRAEMECNSFQNPLFNIEPPATIPVANPLQDLTFGIENPLYKEETKTETALDETEKKSSTEEIIVIIEEDAKVGKTDEDANEGGRTDEDNVGDPLTGFINPGYNKEPTLPSIPQEEKIVSVSNPLDEEVINDSNIQAKKEMKENTPPVLSQPETVLQAVSEETVGFSNPLYGSELPAGLINDNIEDTTYGVNNPLYCMDDASTAATVEEMRTKDISTSMLVDFTASIDLTETSNAKDTNDTVEAETNANLEQDNNEYQVGVDNSTKETKEDTEQDVTVEDGTDSITVEIAKDEEHERAVKDGVHSELVETKKDEVK